MMTYPNPGIHGTYCECGGRLEMSRFHNDLENLHGEAEHEPSVQFEYECSECGACTEALYDPCAESQAEGAQ